MNTAKIKKGIAWVILTLIAICLISAAVWISIELPMVPIIGFGMVIFWGVIALAVWSLDQVLKDK